ncbi:hypothetical protein ACTXM3_18120, partial [Glutamicibacter arilaitensis]|uniref:hypothetical protein n=1 Tax=Glutamicibacter arilaitensis TaxID=256701 RepID=UPI003FD0AA25
FRSLIYSVVRFLCRFALFEAGKLKTKLSAVAMSTALITGLVISGPAANAEVISEEVASAPAES